MKLLDYCIVKNTKVPFFEGTKEYVATGDVEKNLIISSSKVNFHDKPSRANVLIEENDLLFAKMKNTNKVIIGTKNNYKNIYSTGFYCLKCKDNIRPKFLFYYLNSKEFNEKKDDNCSGATMKAINDKGLSKIEVNFPTLTEQDYIIDLYDKLYLSSSNRKRNINLYDNYINSLFIETFGNPIENNMKWDIKKLSDLGTLKNGMNFGKNDAGVKIKFLGVGEFKYGYIFDDNSKLQIINLSEIPSNESLLKNNDIIFVRSNGSKELVGRSLIIQNQTDPVTYSGFCIRFRNTTEIINPNFLIIYFQNKEFINHLKRDSRGANINNINQQLLSNLDIMIPPIDLQNKFVDLVNFLLKQKHILKFDLELIQNLIDSKSQEFFNC